MELSAAERIAQILHRDRGELFPGIYTLSDVLEGAKLAAQPAAVAQLDQAHRKAWIDCGCGYQSNVTWTAPTVSILKRELWDAGYSIWGSCEHL